jgi:Ca-activated chloride channel homolog
MEKITYFITYVKTLEFLHKGLLFLLLIIPLLIAFYSWKRKKMRSSFFVSTEIPFKNSVKSIRQKIYFIPFILRMLGLVLIIIALAQPQSSLSRKAVNVEGIDIVMVLDISPSMRANDFKPNRLEVSKNVIKTFIQNRPNDRIGLVVYGGEAFTKCPLTTDHQTLLTSLKNTTFLNDMIDPGTAIGDGLGTAINRLRESKAKSKVIVLLSDGVNNTGYMDPISAAEIAKQFGIRVYTVGCGSMGRVFINDPVIGSGFINAEIDEVLMKKMADETGGKFFKAQNKTQLTLIYNEIDKMEKTLINETQFTNKSEEYFVFVLMALVLFVLEIILRYTVFRINT